MQDQMKHAPLGVARKRGTPNSDAEVARRWVEVSCAAQGLAVKVTDGEVLVQLVTLLASGRPRSPVIRAARSA